MSLSINGVEVLLGVKVGGTWSVLSGTWTLPAFTLGGNITTNGKSFDAGAGNAAIATTGANKGLAINNTNDDVHGASVLFRHTSATPAVNDTLGRLLYWGNNSTPADVEFGAFDCLSSVVTAGSEESRFEWTTKLAGAYNTAMQLSAAGTLGVDLAGVGTPAQVDLFDKYDDALVLRQGIQQNNRALLADMGVLTRKNNGSGYMMQLQPMVRLLAGGIYQTRQMLEDTREELLVRLSEVEARLARAGLN